MKLWVCLEALGVDRVNGRVHTMYNSSRFSLVCTVAPIVKLHLKVQRSTRNLKSALEQSQFE